MKKTFAVISCFIFFAANAQSVFNRVKNDLAPSAKCMGILDSCNTCNFCKDSVLYYKGLLSLKQNNLTEAKLAAKELQKSYPNFYEVNFLNGLIHLSAKNYGKSINDFTAVLQKNPKHIKALYNRSLAFGLAEEYDKAIEDLSSCIALRPIYPMAYYSRAYWYEYLGNYPAAIKDYENTISQDPKNYDAYLGLAYIYSGLKSNEKSCEIINQAIKAGSVIAEEVKDNFCR